LQFWDILKDGSNISIGVESLDASTVTKMKLIVAIVQDYDCDRLLNAVTESHYRATRIASTGGFLRTGNTTVILGVPDDEVADCLSVINRCCKVRSERRSDEFGGDMSEWSAGGVCEVTIGGAVTFVLAVESFVRIPVASPAEI